MCALWMDGWIIIFNKKKNMEKVERENRCVVAPLLLLFICVTINVYSFVIIFPVSALHVERVRKCVRGRASKFYVKFVQKEPF